MIELNDSIQATIDQFFALPELSDPSLDEAIRLYNEVREYDARMIDEAYADVIISIFRSKELERDEIDRLKDFCLVGLLDPTWSGEQRTTEKITRTLLEKLGLIE
jgi:hypothetical protein